MHAGGRKADGGGTLHRVGPDGWRVAVLRASRPLFVRLLIKLHPARAPLLLSSRAADVVPPITVLFHHAVSEQPVDVATMAGQAVVFASALACVPVRSKGVGPMGCHVVVDKDLQESIGGP